MRAITSTADARGEGQRGLLVLVSAILFVESIFFAALSPLLPYYAETFGLGKSQAGLLTGAYAGGGIAGALPGGVLAARYGVKRAALVGLLGLVAASAAFGFAGSAEALYASRFAQGFGSALAWSSALAWLVAVASRSRRGEVIGVAMGASVAGTLVGPVLGAFAAFIGTEASFTAIAAIGLALAVWVLVTPAPSRSERQRLRALVGGIRQPRLVAGLWLLSLPALLLSVVSVLAPLRLDAAGWGAMAIGTIFFASSAIGAGLSPALGRWSDARGPLAPVRAALVLSIPAALALPWVDGRWTLAALVVGAAAAFGLFWVPATALVADGAEAARLHFGLGFALMNLAWGPAHFVGAAGGGALAAAWSDVAPFTLLAALSLATLAATRRAPLGTP